jgi:hypothetical protein
VRVGASVIQFLRCAFTQHSLECLGCSVDLGAPDPDGGGQISMFARCIFGKKILDLMDESKLVGRDN